MRIAFLGDISLNNQYIDLYHQNVDPFSELYTLLSEYDYVIGNLESPCQGVKTSTKELPKLFTTCETLNYLNRIPVNVVTLGNNHIGDNYEEGFTRTIGKLEELSILYFGAGFKTHEIRKPLILKKEGVKLALFNYYGCDFKSSVPIDSTIKLNLYDKEEILRAISETKKIVNHIVLLFHWGARIEGSYIPDYYMIKDSKDFVDAGCSLIVGHHSHTYQSYEEYSGKFIFYSLGNFAFADYIHNGQIKRIDRTRGLRTGIPVIKFSERATAIERIIYIKNSFSRIDIIKEPNIFYINKIKLKLLENKYIWVTNYFVYKRFDWIFRNLCRSNLSLVKIYKMITTKGALRKMISKMFTKL